MSKKNDNLPAELTQTGEVAEATQTTNPSTANSEAVESKATSDKKATAEQKKAEKAAKADAEQVAAVKAASNVPSDAMLQRIENNAAAQINAGPKVTIFLSPTSKTDKRTEVCINGHWWKIKKGEWVSVPVDVANVLRQSERVLEENERLKGELMVFN